jgi:nicotinate-nucleotide--dimethylbenzimidazole phosphoribosyltransferase
MSDHEQAARDELARKTMPAGALGRLGALAVELAARQRTLAPRIGRVRLVVFAADHGISEAGVSAYPRAVTREMLHAFASGGAAACVLARAHDVEVEVVDVGVDVAADAVPPGIVVAKTRRGTARIDRAPAMTVAERDAAFAAGVAAVHRAGAVDAIAVGEMGIGNTTAAAALLAALTGAPSGSCVGRGTGIDDAGLARKRLAVDAALRRVAGIDEPGRLLAELGGLEIAAMTGAIAAAAAGARIVVVDGFIATVAALVAVRIDPEIRRHLVFAHRSAEAGHALALDALDAEPLLDLGLRLGEGTGAILAIPLLRAAAAVMREMATFDSAGVSDRTPA